MEKYLHPIIMTTIAYIFSFGVLGATLPNPTEVSVVKVKYIDVMYRDCNQFSFSYVMYYVMHAMTYLD